MLRVKAVDNIADRLDGSKNFFIASNSEPHNSRTFAFIILHSAHTYQYDHTQFYMENRKSASILAGNYSLSSYNIIRTQSLFACLHFPNTFVFVWWRPTQHTTHFDTVYSSIREPYNTSLYSIFCCCWFFFCWFVLFIFSFHIISSHLSVCHRLNKYYTLQIE